MKRRSAVFNMERGTLPVVMPCSSEGGFTLVELIIVSIIIGILVTIAIPVYANSRKTAQQRACQANLRTVDGAVESYDAIEHVYPGSLEDLLSADARVLKAKPYCPLGHVAYEWKDGPPPYISCPTSPDHKL